MGRALQSVVLTILSTVAVGGVVVASFYFAYLILLLIVLGLAAAGFWTFYNRPGNETWTRYEDSD